MDQTNIFEFIYPKYHLTKPIRLIECFAGYGSQALALKYLGVPFEHWKICEWNYKSFQAYRQLHMTDDTTDYSKGMNKEEIIEYLASKNISADWNKPMKKEQIKRLGEDKLREIYNNIQATHNLVDISQVHGNDLEIINPDHYTYIMTYSFPCQDLSLAGLRKGMEKGSSTRSGLLWEVERILNELKAKGHLPVVLLMENVPQVHGLGNEEHFREWQLALEKMGYSNYWQDLIATDYGIPQIRNRCFMISILGEYNYNFPLPIKLGKRLKDLLEKEVDDKYYLSERAIKFLQSNTEKQQAKGNGFKFSPIDANEADISKTITARDGQYRMDDTFIEIKPAHGYFPGSVKETDSISAIDAHIDNQHIVIGEKTNVIAIDEQNKTARDDGLIGTLTTDGSSPKHNNRVLIKNATKQGYLEAEDGDGIDISQRMEYHRGTVQKGLSQTLSCAGGGTQGVIVNGQKR